MELDAVPNHEVIKSVKEVALVKDGPKWVAYSLPNQRRKFSKKENLIYPKRHYLPIKTLSSYNAT